MNISKAKEIPGWMIEKELEWLAEQASHRANIMEIGCWIGRSTRALADNAIGLVSVVDTFEGSEEHKEFLSDKPFNWVWDRFQENMSGLSNIRSYRLASTIAADLFITCFPNPKFDMIFLDARHDYDSVREDILAWMPLLAPGGLLCGHDYGPNWPEVAKAVDELIPNVEIGANQIWFRPST